MSLSYRPAPFWFELARHLPYGRDRALNYLRSAGALDKVASFPFHGRRVAIPLDESLLGMYNDLSLYQHRRIRTFAGLCDKHLGQYDLFDCGAHVGLFSAQFTEFSTQVQKLAAIEPNRRLFPILQENLRSVRAIEIECLQAAVADFEGQRPTDRA